MKSLQLENTKDQPFKILRQQLDILERSKIKLPGIYRYQYSQQLQQKIFEHSENNPRDFL